MGAGVAVVAGALALPRMAVVHPLALAPQAQRSFRLAPDPRKWSTLAGSSEIQVAGGPVLFAKGQNIERPIASTTKIMTAYLTLTNPSMPLGKHVAITTAEVLNDRDGILKSDSEVPLKVGQVVTVHDLLWALMLPSADDAAWALSRVASGDHPHRFIAEMNRKARELHMNRTHYTDPDGVSHQAYSTAKDLMKLTGVAMKLPIFRDIVRTKTVMSPFGTLTNLNQMLWQYPGTIGVKTGWTPWAGSCLVFGATRTLHGSPLTVYGVVLGEPSFNPMFQDTAQLMNTAFRVPWTALLPVRSPVATVAVSGLFGSKTYQFSAARPLGAYEAGESARLRCRWDISRSAWRKGQVVGYCRVDASGWPQSPWVPVTADQSYRMPLWGRL